MLIDSSHKIWFLATSALASSALALYLWLERTTVGGLTGGSAAGLAYGIGGALLLIFAGLLSALRKLPAWWWIGSRKLWLRGHIWLGILSVLLIGCHSGFRWGGMLERVLWLVLILTVLTGLFGLVLQQFLPRMITARIPCEAPYEQIPHLCQVMRRNADAILVEMLQCPMDMTMTMTSAQRSLAPDFTKHQFQEFFEKHVRPFLSETYDPDALLANPLQAETAFSRLRALPALAGLKESLTQLETLCAERRLFAEQERLHHWLHGWLLVHVPLSLALLVLGVAHVIMALYY